MHLVLMPFCIFTFFFLVSNLALVKPEKTKAVENYLIQMARYGQLSGKVSLNCYLFFQKVSFIFMLQNAC